jgi:signal transduction histidine kinase
MPRWRSVRVRTTVLATLLVAATLVLASTMLVLTLQRSLTSGRDEVSQALAVDLAHDVEAGTLVTPIPVGEDAMAQVVAPDGRVLAASVSLAGAAPVSDVAPDPGAFERVLLHGVPDDNEHETYRVWALATPSADGLVRVYVGSSPESTQEAVRALRRGLLIGVPAVLVVLAAATSLLVGRALRPVEAIRVEVAAMSPAEPGRRVPVPDTGDEIQRLATTMNAMLRRLDDGHRREREFVADASHELLSPLASFRTQLEVAAANPATTDSPGLVADLLADSDRMERLVRDLLFLAREDEGGGDDVSSLPLLDLDTIVLEEVRRLRVPPGVTVDTSAVSAAPVRGRSEELSRLVRNLVENAVEHATTRVDLELTSGSGVELLVADDGPGIPGELQGRVFERFARAGTERAHVGESRRSGGGTGLGLPIALTIAHRHGGDIVLDSDSSGTRMRVTLPGDGPA